LHKSSKGSITDEYFLLATDANIIIESHKVGVWEKLRDRVEIVVSSIVAYNMITLVPIELIASKIVFLRSEKVLLDRDLAEMYGVETKHLKRAVRRNILRFPSDFMFQLTREEYKSLRAILAP
jgi:hypothetical protein